MQLFYIPEMLRGLDKYPSHIPQSLRQSSTDMILELDEDDSV